MIRPPHATIAVVYAVLFAACAADPDPVASPPDATAELRADTPADTIEEVVADLPRSPETIDGSDSGSDSEPSPDLPPDAPAVDIAEETFVLPEGLVGQAPSSDTTALPSFAGVLDHTGAAITPADLVGQWKAIWFYPLASTTG